MKTIRTSVDFAGEMMDGGFTVFAHAGMCFEVANSDLNGQEIKSGDKIVLHLNSENMIVGLDLNGHKLFLRLQDPEVRFELLPKLLQHRIAMFRKFDENFHKDGEDYESLAMFLGYQIFLVCKTEQEINKFRFSSFTEKIKALKVLTELDPSANQLDFACYFAVLLIKDAATMDINNPLPENLRTSKVMAAANALAAIVGEVRCMPRQKYVDEYVAGL